MNELSKSWHWQISNRITTLDGLQSCIELSPAERAVFEGKNPLPFAITPYYASLLNSKYLRKTVVPNAKESLVGCGELADPLGEEDHRVTPHLIHTYPDKVLFLTTSFCSTYCRYCTRSRMVGQAEQLNEQFEETFEYIAQHTEIRDVLVSGGDPLTMTDSKVDRILTRLRSIPHVRMIRIGSKVPAVLPMRITDELCRILQRHRVWLSLHFIHADELSIHTQSACRKLANHGIGMVSQTVLLKGVNDCSDALTDLFYGLLEMNVKPYYLLQCDPVKGSAHFRTTVKKGIQLIQSLHGRLSGLAIPQYVIDAPGGGGKVPILSECQIKRDDAGVVLLNYRDDEFHYPEPVEREFSDHRTELG